MMLTFTQSEGCMDSRMASRFWGCLPFSPARWTPHRGGLSFSNVPLLADPEGS
jgi:hypothetical protein